VQTGSLHRHSASGTGYYASVLLGLGVWIPPLQGHTCSAGSKSTAGAKQLVTRSLPAWLPAQLAFAFDTY